MRTRREDRRNENQSGALSAGPNRIFDRMNRLRKAKRPCRLRGIVNEVGADFVSQRGIAAHAQGKIALPAALGYLRCKPPADSLLRRIMTEYDSGLTGRQPLDRLP